MKVIQGGHILRLLKGDTLIIGVIILSLLVSSVGVFLDQPWLSIILPAIAIGSYFVLFNIRQLYFLLFFFIPLSAEIEIGGGFSTDLPGEPLLWLMFIVSIFYIGYKGFPKKLINQTTAIISIHLVWILFTAIFAMDQTISAKYLLAKTWYVIPFYVLSAFIIKENKDIKTIFKYFVGGTFIASIYFFIQHFQLDLTYLSRTNAGQPIWRNHVNYAVTIVINLPMLWYLYKTSKHPDRLLYLVMMSILTFFMYFAYARISYLCLMTGFGYLIVLKLKMTKVVILLSICIVIGGLLWLQHNNQYLHLAQDHDTVIMQSDFGGKVNATTSGNDISTMERLHRWVASYNMIKDKPITGVGPANFYNSYKPYTVHSFETYVSDNPERSGIHNYYLMVLVEQGFIGLVIFLALVIISLIKVEKSYHSSTGSNRMLILTSGIIIVMILTINTVNDMIEVIKIGGIFFFMLFLISSYQLEEQPSK